MKPLKIETTEETMARINKELNDMIAALDVVIDRLKVANDVLREKE